MRYLSADCFDCNGKYGGCLLVLWWLFWLKLKSVLYTGKHVVMQHMITAILILLIVLPRILVPRALCTRTVDLGL